MLPNTADRVPLNTAGDLNWMIQRQIDESVRFHADQPQRIGQRLRELDREWDVERTLEANAAALAFVGVALSAIKDKRWLALPALVSAFLFQHATQGWCPPLPVLRRLGFRTMREIDTERFALKALRGDFGLLGPGGEDNSASRALQATRL